MSPSDGRTRDGHRPDAPDPALLDRAAEAIAARDGGDAPVTWRVRDRLERPKSTIFVLEASRPDRSEPVRCHYKVDVGDIDGRPSAALVTQRRRSLEVEARFAPALEAAADGMFAVDRALLIDAERHVAVREHVDGAPLGKAVRWARPGLRRDAAAHYRSIGRAIRTIEQVGRRIDEPVSADRLEHRLQRALSRSREVLSDAAVHRVEHTISELVPQVAADGLVWSHGDVGPTNVLVAGNRIGVIDFSWVPQLPTWDLVRFLARLECETPRLPRWTARLATEVLASYGLDPAEPTASYRLARLQRCLLAIRDPHPVVRRWGVDRLLVEVNT